MCMLHRHKVALALAIFVLWLGLTSLALFKFGNENYGVFAFDTNWQNPALAKFNLTSLGIAESAGIQVVHVKQDNCICNNRAQLHQDQFSQQYNIDETAQFSRSIQQVADVGFNLPAAPAVLIFDSGVLLYAGPYATGPMCSISDSLIAPILLQQIKLPGPWLNAEAKSCRCLVKKPV